MESQVMMLIHVALSAAMVGVLIAIVIVYRAVKHRLPQNQYESLLASNAEIKLAIYDQGRESAEFRLQLRRELDNLHERLELLEEVERRRK